MKEPAPGPVWWTTLDPSFFMRSPPPRNLLLSHCYKCQTWFEARAKLGKNPVRLEVADPRNFEVVIQKLERLHGR